MYLSIALPKGMAEEGALGEPWKGATPGKGLAPPAGNCP